MSGIQVAYPDQLPCPTTAPLSPTLRVLQSDLPGPTGYRGFQRDFHATQQLEWMLTAEQAQLFDMWWRDTLHRGGLWFLADWPLLMGRVNNVYRFASPPSWQYMPGGPRGAGMHRVRAAVEVRGRGVPPRNFDLLIITSKPYPVELQDGLGLSFGFVLAGDQTWPSDDMSMGFGFQAGELRDPAVLYAAVPEELFMAFGFAAGELKEPTVLYDRELPDDVGMVFGFDSGSLVVTLVEYEEWPAEAAALSFGFDSGALS